MAINLSSLSMVAPHAGAWIETPCGQSGIGLLMPSRPTRARGLKLCVAYPGKDGTLVAPHAGAWIETPTCSASLQA